MMQLVEQYFWMIPFPDVEETLDLLVTKVHMSISAIDPSSVDVGTETVTLQEGEATIALDGLSFSYSFDWEYDEIGWPYIHDGGTGTVTVSDVSASGALDFGLDTKCSSVTAEISDFSMDLAGKIKVHLDGGASALYNVVLNTLLDVLDSVFTALFEDNVADIVSLAIDEQFASMTDFIHTDMYGDYVTDFRLTDTPLVYDTYLELFMHGWEYPLDTYDAPLEDVPQFPDTILQKDMQVSLSRHAINRTFTVHIADNLFTGTVKPSNLSNPSLGVLLTTEYYQAIMPNLYAKYPDRSLSATLTATGDSDTEVLPSGLLVTAAVSVTVSVLSEGGEEIAEASVVSMSGTLGMACQVSISMANHWQIATSGWSPYNWTFTLDNSKYDQFDPNNYMLMSSYAALEQYGVAPFMEYRSHYDAINLPMYSRCVGFNEDTTIVRYQDDAALIGFDVQKVPYPDC
ncbi:hypothetical protein KIPB_000614 [Kipferlia bialata]|uniref:Lipid-binding serum glycoprotein C-terminal domain-containing protein n=1 Tax=Kipferlia bialata TaxID=797122 RepID=A0A9K3CNR6_9EUKA|nr:hypothetical protein KIPB_000614 [Kipferlia bialata]|eukprot:g614.t1